MKETKIYAVIYGWANKEDIVAFFFSREDAQKVCNENNKRHKGSSPNYVPPYYIATYIVEGEHEGYECE